MAQNLAALRRCGEIAMVGVLSLGQIDPVMILIGGALVRGVMVGSRAEFEALVRALEHHQIHPVIDKKFGFTEVGAAFDHLRSGSHFGKIVIEA